MRSLTVAQALRNHCPQARIEFVLSKLAPFGAQCPFPTYLIDGVISSSIAPVNEIFRRERPDVVILDNAGRTSHLTCLKRLGIRTVFLSSRPARQRKAFRLRWLNKVNQHWILHSSLLGHPLTRSQRLKHRLVPYREIVVLHTIFPESDRGRRQTLKDDLGIGTQPYVLFSPGGGGWQINGRPTAEVFAEAAGDVAAKLGIRALVVMGPLYRGPLAEMPGAILVPSLSNTHMIDVIHDARLLVIGGGSLVAQALACQRVCVAVPAGGKDQEVRIRQLSNLGVLAAAELHADSMSRAVVQLLQDLDRYRAMQVRVQELGIRNGLPDVIAGLERLLS